LRRADQVAGTLASASATGHLFRSVALIYKAVTVVIGLIALHVRVHVFSRLTCVHLDTILTGQEATSLADAETTRDRARHIRLVDTAVAVIIKAITVLIISRGVTRDAAVDLRSIRAL
jgi:hypothetical protein